MEQPKFTVLLYSKYSSYSKKIMSELNSAGVDFSRVAGLQTLCIDNAKVKKRIMDDKQIDIKYIPCILVIYPDGGIEKYDGSSAFEWTEQLILKYAPPSQPQPQPQPQQGKDDNKEDPHPPSKRRPIKNNMKKIGDGDEIKEMGDNPNVTPISDLPMDEDDDISADRYRQKKPRGRIRINEGNYDEDEELFQGDAPDMRKAKKSALKTAKNIQSGGDIMARAKALAKSRELDNSKNRVPPGMRLPTGN